MLDPQQKHGCSFARCAPDMCCLQYWSACITKAQAPNPLSSRDGGLLRPVPKAWKLPPSELTQKLQEAMQKLHEVQAGLLCAAWGSTGQPDKASLALMRGYAYARAGRPEQALRVSQFTTLHQSEDRAIDLLRQLYELIVSQQELSCPQSMYCEQHTQQCNWILIPP